jgi:hypothetical protein
MNKYSIPIRKSLGQRLLKTCRHGSEGKVGSLGLAWVQCSFPMTSDKTSC